MSPTLPALVQGFVVDPDGPTAAPLLAAVHREVRVVSRPYPPAYFALGQKSEQSVADLGNRVFTVCAAVEKGRFPFLGRVPFAAYVEERMDGRAVRYHSFRAKISITREILRDDYARNVVRDPELRWRAELHRAVGVALRDCARSRVQGRGQPPVWDLEDAGPRVLLRWDRLREHLVEHRQEGTAALVRRALARGGPASHHRLSSLLAEVVEPPALDAVPAAEDAVDLPTRLALREAVRGAWQELAPEDQALLTALVRGDSYDELVARDGRFAHKVAVSRAVKRCGDLFLERILEELGVEAGHRRSPPLALVEAVMEVLEEALPLGPLAAAGGV